VTGFGEEAVVFWPSFLGSGFASEGSERNRVGSDHGQHFSDEGILFARVRAGGMNGSCEVAGVKGSGMAY
jgi:hypothetical protein